jgi:hypothetical protein
MSQIKHVELMGNTLFPAENGGYADQRTQFTAGPRCELSEDEGVGVHVVLVGDGLKPSTREFTIPWAQIKYVEWATSNKPKGKEQKPAA